MTCSSLDLDLLHFYHPSHHITSTSSPYTCAWFSPCLPSSTTHRHGQHYSRHRVIRLLAGNDQEESNWATLCPLPCPSVPACLLPDQHSISPIKGKQGRKIRRANQTSLVGTRVHPDVASPCSGWRHGDGEMAWGSPWLIPAVLGLWDWGPQMAPPPKRTEGGKKRAAKVRNGRPPRAGSTRNQGWGPSLSLPISPVFCIEYPCLRRDRGTGAPACLLI